MSHTPEPWIFTVAGDFYCGLIMGRHGGEVFDGDFTEANARRIVACVNACAGVPTEVLEEGGQGTVAASMARLTEQRDELLAALEYSIKQVPELATVPGIAEAIAEVKANK